MGNTLISVISPSIRPEGLKTTFETLKKQTLSRDEWEWLPRLSLPGEKPDLCYQVNQALKEAKGELIVFLQDHIEIEPDALEKCLAKFRENPLACYTMPVGKRNGKEVDWDWRAYCEGHITYERFEIDWGFAPAKAIKEVMFDERYDSGFGWENTDTAYILSKKGWEFAVDPENKGIAFDHDAHEPHPYKKNSNASLWLRRKEAIDLIYAEG